MVIIHAVLDVQGEQYTISAESENPNTVAELMLQARENLLAGLKKEEEK